MWDLKEVLEMLLVFYLFDVMARSPANAMFLHQNFIIRVALTRISNKRFEVLDFFLRYDVMACRYSIKKI